MFNWNLITILILISSPGIIVTTPGLVRSITRALKPKLPEGKTLPSAPVLGILLGLEVLILVSGSAILGNLAALKIGLRAPFFEALASGGDVWANAVPQFLPLLIGGISGGLVLVAGYYLVFRPAWTREPCKAWKVYAWKWAYLDGCFTAASWKKCSPVGE